MALAIFLFPCPGEGKKGGGGGHFHNAVYSRFGGLIRFPQERKEKKEEKEGVRRSSSPRLKGDPRISVPRSRNKERRKKGGADKKPAIVNRLSQADRCAFKRGKRGGEKGKNPRGVSYPFASSWICLPPSEKKGGEERGKRRRNTKYHFRWASVNPPKSVPPPLFEEKKRGRRSDHPSPYRQFRTSTGKEGKKK